MFSAPKHRNTETSFKQPSLLRVFPVFCSYRINQLGWLWSIFKKTYENPIQLVLKIYYIGIDSRRMKYNISPSIQQSFPINPINRFELIRDSSAGQSGGDPTKQGRCLQPSTVLLHRNCSYQITGWIALRDCFDGTLKQALKTLQTNHNSPMIEIELKFRSTSTFKCLSRYATVSDGVIFIKASKICRLMGDCSR